MLGLALPIPRRLEASPDYHHFNSDLRSTKARGDLSPIFTSKGKELRRKNEKNENRSIGNLAK